MRWPLITVVLAACGGHHTPAPPVTPKTTGQNLGANDPDGPHKQAIAQLIQPFVDAELVDGIVVGVYDNGSLEIYGFGKGPNNAHPNGHTLYELGGVSKLYTGLLLAAAVDRQEVKLDALASELMPAGVPVPSHGTIPITLRQLANETSGMPPYPPGVRRDQPDPFGTYDEERLFQDLQRTDLPNAPGSVVSYSTFGAGLLGWVLGHKLVGAGPGAYEKALTERVLVPLELKDTFVAVPNDAASRRAIGTNTDLQPVPLWRWDALAAGGGLISDVRDQLTLIKAELDAAKNGAGTLRSALRRTQEPQQEEHDDQPASENQGLGVKIDAEGRVYQNGSTGGFHSFVGWDPKARRGVVILASTALSPLDRVADSVYDILDGKKLRPPVFPEAASLLPYAGSYDVAGTALEVVAERTRLYAVGPDGSRVRLVPLAPGEFWVEELSAVIVFEEDAGKIARLVLLLPNSSRVVGTRK